MIRLRLSTLLTTVALLVAVATLGGCRKQGGGRLSIRSSANELNVLRGGFERGIYTFDGRNTATFVLFDGPVERPTQAVTIRLFWTPQAGRTPIDRTATNATIHYLIFTPGDNAQAGVYSGAGFVYPAENPGGKTIEAAVWESNLLLTDRSEAFNDLLGQAVLKGSFAAKRDDLAVAEALRRLDGMVRERLGYPRFVDASGFEER
jgi:hypothetical protein